MPRDAAEWPDEPDEPDPEQRWGDPEDDLVSVPSVDIPGEEGDEESAGIEVDGDLAKFFWAAVIYANVALAGISIGLLLVAFRDQWVWGGGAVAVGLFALYRTYDLYRTYREDISGDEPGEAGGGTGEAGDGTGEAGDGTDETGDEPGRSFDEGNDAGERSSP
ncbi:DUF7322 domain-containing protein [Halobellus sp. GM3]|uniref:DUF7322 domain-containing protein n=1 Tax=Halobellus sp. GM3 TaxID=3458410 RepID=UPI00403DC978